MATSSEINVVTGAFGFTGKYITRRLLSMGKEVRTLTGHPDRENPYGEKVRVFAFDFDKPAALVENLRGATALYNTYWIRFAHKDMTFEKAIENSKILIRAAEDAGVQRIVHVSITNPSEDSTLPYFRGKALVEKAIRESSLSHAIIRPAVVFGQEDILINNIAWLLRHFPVFGVPGSGDYRMQPVFVEDMAEMAVSAGQQAENITVDALGPEVFAFNELVRLIAETVGSKARVVHLPPGLALSLVKRLGGLLHDVVLTRDEVDGLMANLLVSEAPPTGQTRLSDWLKENAATVGRDYHSELARHYR